MSFLSFTTKDLSFNPPPKAVVLPYHHLCATVACSIGVLFFHLLHLIRFCHIGHLRRAQILNPTPKSGHRSARRISALLHAPRSVPSRWQQTPDSRWQLRQTGRPTETLMCWDGPPDLIYVIHREAGSSCHHECAVICNVSLSERDSREWFQCSLCVCAGIRMGSLLCLWALAALCCHFPMSAITVGDGHRQLFTCARGACCTAVPN